MNKKINLIAEILSEGKICFLPTDTIYGLHCLSNNENAIEKIYNLKERPEDFKFINLISKLSHLEEFGVILSDQTEELRELVEKLWPGPNTIIFEQESGQNIALRMPSNEFLFNIMSVTGPLVSTSANKHGEPPVKNVGEAKQVFGDEIDYYFDAGEINNPPSSIYKVENQKIIKIR